VLAFKGLDYVAVAQEAGGENPALLEWTGQASAPVLAWNDEAPRCLWLDQLMLAERLAPAAPLLGSGIDERVLITGLCREIAGEGGVGWVRRNQLTGIVLSSGKAPPYMSVMARRYGYSQAAFEASEQQLVGLLAFFAARLDEQAALHSDYLVGRKLSAADLYLANFIGMLKPLPAELNPMPEPMRQTYSYLTPQLAEVLAPVLLDYRDMIYRRHIKTPLDF
jgi:glutathione S-transferase